MLAHSTKRSSTLSASWQSPGLPFTPPSAHPPFLLRQSPPLLQLAPPSGGRGLTVNQAPGWTSSTLPDPDGLQSASA